MDYYAEMPMPSIEQRVSKLLSFIENPTDVHFEIATKVVSETTNYSMMGYIMGNIGDLEKSKFLKIFEK